MAIASSDKLVVVKAFAPSNPLPLDAREIYDSLAAAQAYAASSAIAYAGQTIKVVENDTVTVYTLVPSADSGVNFKLSFVGGGAGSGVQNIGTSATEGNIAITVADGENTTNKDIPVVGALVNPVVNEDAHTLTLTKIGATPAQNSEVVVPLGGASPDTIISAVEQGTDGLTVKVTKFSVEDETSTTETIKIFGAVTGVDASVAGILDMASTNAAGAAVHTKEALVGAVINAAYDAETKVLTLPVVTGKDDLGAVTTKNVTIDMKAAVAGAFVDVTTTADTTTSSAKHTFTYKDAVGASKTKDIFESGVRKVEAGTTVDKIKVTVADTTGALTSSELLVGAGNVKNPTYDADTRKITLPTLQADGTTKDLVINLGKDLVVTSGTYNTKTKNIELTITDGSKVLIAASDLVDVYTAKKTSTINTTVTDNEISAELILSTDAKNLIKVDATNGGVKVVESDFVETKKLITDGDAATLKSAKEYADTQDETNLTAAKTYADTQDAETLKSAKSYADTQDATNLTAAKDYTDTEVGKETTARETAITNVLKEAKEYADDKAAAAGTTWVDFGAK